MLETHSIALETHSIGARDAFTNVQDAFTMARKALHQCPKGSKADAMTGEEVATEIENFLENRGGTYDWDDFICVPLVDPFLDQIRESAARTHERYPPAGGKGWCNDEGIAVLRELARQAREYGLQSQASHRPQHS